MATFGNITLTAGTGQIQEWQANSGGAGTDVNGAGSIKAGAAPTVTMQWTRSSSQVWAMGAVSVRPAIKTAVQLRNFEALWSHSGVILQWHSEREFRNLGFNVYREHRGQRIRLNSSLIAGSALMMREGTSQHGARSYRWLDSSPELGTGTYWLEAVDLNGARTMFGPVSVVVSSVAADLPVGTQSPMLALEEDLQSGHDSHPVETTARNFEFTAGQRQRQFELAANPAVKIFVQHEGWYRITQRELIAAGLAPDVDPSRLHLYAEANEQPIRITGASAGPGTFGPDAAIEFYGTGIDTQYSDTRVYWLVATNGPGTRVQRLTGSFGSNRAGSSFPYEVELQQRTTYFAALITQNGDNFFGALVSTVPVNQTLCTPHFDPNSTEFAYLDVLLRGVIAGASHDVTVSLNGVTLGDISFIGEGKGHVRISLQPGLLLDGTNTVTLAAKNGADDISLVDRIRLKYPHTYTADSDELKFTARAGNTVRVSGFDSLPSEVLDITNPARPIELTPRIWRNKGEWDLEVQVPWFHSENATLRHTLLAVGRNRIAAPSRLASNHPSRWHAAQPGAEIVMVSHPDFTSALVPLVRLHRAHGKSVALVSIDDLFDEFNFGERSPEVIRSLLLAATQQWRATPKYLLLNGRASLDPRNYLGFGDFDFVPTKIVPTESLMTASDDWFSDFRDTGFPTIATGRLPVTTVQEAQTVVEKLVAYQSDTPGGEWTNRALMVADQNDTEDFTRDSQLVQSELPQNMHVTDVFASSAGITGASQDIVQQINAGQLVVNYIGHGSEQTVSRS